MSETPWLGDACSLVDAFRSGERKPADELEAVLGAIERSTLNAVPFVDAEGARAAAEHVDVARPFGGVPLLVKELDAVEGWPYTEASLVFADRKATWTGTMVSRIREAGGITVGQSISSEFGGLNVSVTKLHGVTGNAWNPSQTAGGSSGGSATAVAGGLVPIATGGDGGGSIRIPAGFCGLVGMKGTFGRIPRGPHAEFGALTVNIGCLARSVRDVARWYDVTNGYDSRDRFSVPRVDGWERGLGTHDLAGKKVAIAPTLGVAILRAEVEAAVLDTAAALAADAGLEVVDLDVRLPGLGFEWAMANMASLALALGDHWPACQDDLTQEMAFGLTLASQTYNLEMAAKVEDQRVEAVERMAALFDEVDFVICATNPDVAFPAAVGANTRVGDRTVGLENNGALTIPANICGNPAISIPAGTFEGLPIGMQVIGRHYDDALLLDLARVVEQQRPWPLVAPGAPI
jgi:aspartyl-tRNA(Asn)/glutamyl-tRNA(Gln) amidotransferase subunit A